MAQTRKRVVKLDTSKPKLVIENGEVKEVPYPVLEQHEVSDPIEVGKVPTWNIETPNGTAKYEYVGNCQECTWQKKETPVFRCITGAIKAHGELGNQLAAFWNDGGSKATPLCQEHYKMRSGQVQKSETVYKVIESNKFG